MQEIVDESKKLIKEEVNLTPDAKICTIGLSINKSLLAKHLFDDSSDNTYKVFKGR